MNRLLRCIVALFFTTIITQGQSTAVAEDPASDCWTFRLAPYAWATALNGTTGFRGIKTNVDISIGDVIEDVDGALMVAFEARHDRWSITTDLIYADLSDSAPSPRGVVFNDASLDVQEILWTETLGYTVVKSEQGSIDLLAGMRLISLDLDLNLDGATLPSGEQIESRELSRGKTWVDPIIGFRARLNFSDQVFWQNMADIGGFGAASSLTWQALTALGYEITPNSSIGLGYRGLGYDYDRDQFEYDMDMFGPFLGAQFKF